MAKKQGGGPAWLATFADMMSLLMAFFVMLFAMSSVETSKYEALVESLTDALGHGRDLTATQKQYFQQTKTQPTPSDNTGTAAKTAIEELKPLYDSLIETYASELKKTQVNVKLLDNGNKLLITFPSKVAFPPGRASLTPEFIQMLAKLPSWKNQPVRIKVLGHTDSRPIHNLRFRNNWELSSARAATTITALIRLGKIRPDQAMAVGLADTRPIDPRPTEEAYRKNRRVEILVETIKPEETDTKKPPEGGLDDENLSKNYSDL